MRKDRIILICVILLIACAFSNSNNLSFEGFDGLDVAASTPVPTTTATASTATTAFNTLLLPLKTKITANTNSITGLDTRLSKIEAQIKQFQSAMQ